MNQENKKKDEPMKKVTEGAVEFRDNDQENIIKGAKQEDQLNKLNQGEKAARDQSGSKPVASVPNDKNKPSQT